jgi:hypothetical protein
LKDEESRRRALDHASYSRRQAKEISREKSVWKIVKWHIDEKGRKGVIWVKKIGESNRYDREEEIPVESRGIDNWSDALRWPGYIMIDFDYHGEWEGTGDYLKPRLLKKE